MRNRSWLIACLILLGLYALVVTYAGAPSTCHTDRALLVSGAKRAISQLNQGEATAARDTLQEALDLVGESEEPKK